MKKVCVDTDILGWYVKGNASEEQKADEEKAKFLFEWFEEKNLIVVIPSLVVGEILSDVQEEDQREEISDFINDNFDVLQYDILSARIFAEIQVEKNREREKLANYRKENDVRKCKMKNDWNIASCAISNGCDTIFSNNSSDFKAFVGDRLPVFDLTFVDKVKEEIAEQERIEKERIAKEEARKKEPQDGELLPKDLSEFPTAEEARLKKEEMQQQVNEALKGKESKEAANNKIAKAKKEQSEITLTEEIGGIKTSNNDEQGEEKS